MERNRACSILQAILFLLLAAGFAASTSFISADVLESRGSTGRNLLQTNKGCPINFEVQNYTILTSKCQGPKYLPELCCPAFREFVCPFAKELQDGNYDCASTMYSYIDVLGSYQPALFDIECKDAIATCNTTDSAGKENSSPVNAGHLAHQSLSPLVVLVAGLAIQFS